MNCIRWGIPLLAVLVFYSSCQVLKSIGNRKSKPVAVKIVGADTTKKDSSQINQLKPYHEVITSEAETRVGLFTVHTLNNRYLWEVPTSILNKEILLVSRIKEGAADGQVHGHGYSGDVIGESQIAFSRGFGNKVFIRLLSFNSRSTDSSINGMHRTVQASNLQPILNSFDIKAINPTSLACVIDVTDFLNSDNPLLYFDAPGKKALSLGGYQKDRSYVNDVRTFPSNLEVNTVATYTKNDLPLTYLLNASFVLLPEKLMHPRYYDKRVGYFYRQYKNFDAPGGVEVAKMITRWRLEPKPEDKERYLRGEMVEPQKPIVYYIDPVTPKKWIPYLIQGVNDWQKAFEKAGFKNAIYALPAPINDSTFSLFDARHNAIIYKASDIPNASGPHVHDPRTGEILETHINWYHNIQRLIHDWYMVQAGPNDKDARTMVFNDTLMGQLIRFVSSHEVGHTLGLRHNMGASSTVPTDSLRSKTYLEKNGFCPSIMDYARFNYVAQPEDGLSREDLMPRIGVYDEWAIEWGYRWFPDLNGQEEESAYFDKWINAKLNADKRLWWWEGEPGPFAEVADPRVQTEDLGDNAMKANFYGIKNLKRVLDSLKSWTTSPYKDYSDLMRMYKHLEDQYNRYIMHVANNIANKYATQKMASQEGAVIKFIPRAVQKEAMQFLNRELFDTPNWLYDKDIFSVIGGSGDYAFLHTQQNVINYLVNFVNYMTMSWAQMQQPEDVYTFDEMLTDLDAEIWKELDTKSPISFRRRNLQKSYAERLVLISLPSYNIPGGTGIAEKLTYDFYPIFQKHLKSIIGKINKQLPHYKDELTVAHLLEIKKHLEEPLKFRRFTQPSSVSTPPSKSYNNYFETDVSPALEVGRRDETSRFYEEITNKNRSCIHNYPPLKK